MKISRILLLALVLLTLTHIIGAKLISGYIEGGVRTAVLAYSQQAGYPIDVQKVESGWFTSTVDVRVPIPAVFAEPFRKLGLNLGGEATNSFIQYETTITHGPVIFDEGFHLAAARASGEVSLGFDDIIPLISNGIGSEVETALKGKLNEEYDSLLALTRSRYAVDVSFNGDVLYTGSSEGGKASVELPENEAQLASISMDVSPAIATWFLSGDRGLSKTTLTWAGMNAAFKDKNAEEVGFQIGAVDMQGAARRMEEYLWAGSTDFSIDGIEVNARVEERSFRVKSGKLSAVSNVTGNKEKAGFVDALTKVILDDFLLEFGEGKVAMDSFIMDGVAQNISTKFLEAEASASLAMWRDMDTAMQQSEFAFMESPTFAAAIDAQLAATPKVIVENYSFIGEDGEISFNGYLQLNPGLTQANLKESILFWQNLEGEFDFTLSDAFIKTLAFEGARLSARPVTREQISQLLDVQLSAYVGAGVLTKKGADYTSKVTIADDAVVVNGTPLMQLSQVFLNTDNLEN